MRLYEGSSPQFIKDTTLNQIAEKLKSAFLFLCRYNPSPQELNSWRNSMRAISQVFQFADLLDHGVILEYQLPMTSRRLDCLVTGRDNHQSDNAVIIELKQRDKCRPFDGDREVITPLGFSEKEVLHPSVQVGQYKTYLEDTHTAFYEGDNPVRLSACSYLHNYSFDQNDVLPEETFRDVLLSYPLFSADDVAHKNDYLLFEYELDVQFRCAGSEAFVNWINNTLGISKTANIIWTGEEPFDFRIIETPEKLEAAIREKIGEGYTARLSAGFCWDWSKELNRDGTLREDVRIGEYRRPWNARPEATRLPKGIPKATLWAYDPRGIDQIGCIYTVQGFEFDYIGVIFGPDLTYDLDSQEWRGHPEKSGDPIVRKSKDRFVELVKNTYRVLLSRGMKGCYVHFMDKDTERFFRSRMETKKTFQ